MTTGAVHEPTWGDPRYWPEPVEPLPARDGVALDLLAASIRDGATIVAIGAFTNLAHLELERPGALAGTRVVAMSGWLPGQHAPTGLPEWGAAMDWNTQCDTQAAAIVAGAADLTLVTLPAAMSVQLRAPDLQRLRDAGDVGALLARQSVQHAADHDFGAITDGLVNFHWDPVTAAVAVGWDGATVEDRRIAVETRDDVLVYVDAPGGRPARVVVDLDGDAFADYFLGAIERIAR
jgi:inosine-uridine nucleoside N-ribohydrolase